MKFMILGHACLYVEHQDTRLLIDPWLVGSCYWRSWWNYPEVDKGLLQQIKPTHIYLTHLHWDHYHGPTLRLFEKQKPTIILPKACTRRMVEDMKKYFSFSNIIEVSHSKTFHGEVLQ